jgi:hypothetical protein
MGKTEENAFKASLGEVAAEIRSANSALTRGYFMNIDTNKIAASVRTLFNLAPHSPLVARLSQEFEGFKGIFDEEVKLYRGAFNANSSAPHQYTLPDFIKKVQPSLSNVIATIIELEKAKPARVLEGKEMEKRGGILRFAFG